MLLEECDKLGLIRNRQKSETGAVHNCWIGIQLRICCFNYCGECIIKQMLGSWEKSGLWISYLG